MTTSSLLILVNTGLALLATFYGLFASNRFSDRWTPVLLAYLGAALWFIMGLSSYDVILGNNTTGEAVVPFVIIGYGIGVLVFLFATHDLVFGAGEEAAEVREQDYFRP